MLKQQNFFLGLALTLLSFGCHTINSVSLTQIPAKRGKAVKAEVSKFIFFGLTFDNDFVDPLVTKLRDQCNGGSIKGILTKDETVNYFLGLFITRRVIAKGYCLGNNGQTVSQLEPNL